MAPRPADTRCQTAAGTWAASASARDHLARQDADRARLELPAAGPATLLFTWPDGRELHPDLITGWFQRHARAGGLPVLGEPLGQAAGDG